MATPDIWYTIDNTGGLDSPALVVYRQRLIHNIKLLVQMAGGPGGIRPHVKTHKTPEVVQLMLDDGITKFKCATIAEAEMLGLCGAADVLLAYPVTGPKLFRLVSLIRKYPKTVFSCLVDNAGSAGEISDRAAAENIMVNVYLDLNVGMNRTGIAPGKQALRLYEECSILQNVSMRGLHVYDGHIRDRDIVERTRKCNEAFEPVEAMWNELLGKGFAVGMIAGGSSTLPVHLRRQNVECSPGTFVYWDKGYSEWIPELGFLPAALVMTRIISLPDPHLICTDLGHKSIAAEKDLHERFSLLNAPELVPESQSEEHLVLRSLTPHTRKPGDILYVLPGHICPTCALYAEANVVDEDRIIDVWKITARDRVITV